MNAKEFLESKGCTGQIETLRISPPCTKPSDGTLIEWLEEYASLKQQWIPVEERLPEIGQEVLAVIGDNAPFSTKYHSDGYWRDMEEGIDYEPLFEDYSDIVTHWMPLPNSHKSEK